MASTVQAVKGKRRKSAKPRKTGSAWVGWLIVVAGFAAIPVAVWGAGVLALSGQVALAILYPYLVLAKLASAYIPAVVANPLAQWLLYLQFPLYGILMARVHVARGFWIALNVIVWLHVLAWILAFVLIHVQNPYLGF